MKKAKAKKTVRTHTKRGYLKPKPSDTAKVLESIRELRKDAEFMAKVAAMVPPSGLQQEKSAGEGQPPKPDEKAPLQGQEAPAGTSSQPYGKGPVERILGMNQNFSRMYGGADQRPAETRELVAQTTTAHLELGQAIYTFRDAVYSFERVDISDTRELTRKSEDLSSARQKLIIARQRLLDLNNING